MTPEEFTRICIPLADGLYRTAYGLLGSAQEAEDAVQDLYLKLWSRREMLSEVRNIPAWIGVLLRNLCIDRLRGRKDASDEPVPVDLPEETAPEPDYTERIDRTYRAVNALPAKDWKLLRLRLLEGLSYEEIARRTGLTENALRVAFYRLKHKIKRYL